MQPQNELADLVAHSLLDQHHILEQPSARTGMVGTVLVHIVLGFLLMVVPWNSLGPRSGPHIVGEFKQITPLVAPPAQLTQKTPSTGKPALEVNLEGLLSRPNAATQARAGMTQPAAPKRFEAPTSTRMAAQTPRPMIEAPKIEERPRDFGDLQARNLPGLGSTTTPPPIPVPKPEIQADEKPKLAFERPGSQTGNPNNTGTTTGKIPAPQRGSMDDMVRQAARAGGGGLTVGDIGEGVGGLGESLNSPAAPPRNGSSLQLLSDPMGADFRPYLIRILSTVRRNWFAVMPESVRLGRRGRVLIQFAINKDGSVPKLVIAQGSGTEALDRAAVAGISASNPFPPLPDEFKGLQVRLQFTFSYNIPSR
jgi:TonB family protein